VVFRNTDGGVLDLPRTAFAAKLPGQFADLSETRRRNRMPPAAQSATRVHRQAAAERGDPGLGKRPARATFAKAERLAGFDFRDRRRVS